MLSSSDTPYCHCCFISLSRQWVAYTFLSALFAFRRHGPYFVSYQVCVPFTHREKRSETRYRCHSVAVSPHLPYEHVPSGFTLPGRLRMPGLFTVQEFVFG